MTHVFFLRVGYWDHGFESHLGHESMSAFFFVLSYVGRGLETNLFTVQGFLAYVSIQDSETWKTERPGPQRPVSASERHRTSNRVLFIVSCNKKASCLELYISPTRWTLYFKLQFKIQLCFVIFCYYSTSHKHYSTTVPTMTQKATHHKKGYDFKLRTWRTFTKNIMSECY
jgi:hypothetical protein